MPPAGSRDAVLVMRGGLVESVHEVAWCVVEDGRVAAASAADAPGLEVFLRSVAKPLQALPAIRAGVPERFGLDARGLALGCASHGGGEEHVAVVADLLGACGLTEGDLGCGPGEPRDPRAAAALAAAGRRPTPLHHNCSGKHALGLALCAAEGWATAGYLDAAHPLQAAMRGAVAEATGVAAAGIPEATDGCGMRTWRVPLAAAAVAFARLASGGLGSPGDRLAAVMRAHPRLVGFAGSVDSELMAAVPGLVAKVGAEGLLAIGTPDGRGLALKVRDGAARALEPAGVAAARGPLGLRAEGEALDRLAAALVRNSRGEEVGRAEARLAP
jgi:L-asparaginase II